MTWWPESPNLHITIDITSTIAHRMEAPQGTAEKIKRKMKTSSGTSNVEFTDCAALVFPKLDELAITTGSKAETKEKLRHYKGFADTYFDRRAQAKHMSWSPYTLSNHPMLRRFPIHVTVPLLLHSTGKS